MSEPESEFGKGFLYPLALFMAHADRLPSDLRVYKELAAKNPGHYGDDDGKNEAATMWLYGAADHMYEFMPNAAPEHLRGRCSALKDKALKQRFPMDDADKTTYKEVGEMIVEAKALFFEIDRHNGVDAIRGDNE